MWDFGMAVTLAGPYANNHTSFQTNNHTKTSSLNFKGWMFFLTPNQQCQSTESSKPLTNTKTILKLGT